MRASSAAWMTMAFVASTHIATADDRESRVLVLAPDAALAHAITSALRPWGVTVITSNIPPLDASMPSAATAARAIAEREHVDGVAWVSKSEQGPALWTYDIHTDQTVSRALQVGPPYDEASAASVALSLKTLLRSTEVAPKEERIATQRVAPAPPPPFVPTTNVQKEKHPTTEPAPWSLRVAATARSDASSNAQVEPRLGLSVWRRRAPFAIGLGASVGTGTSTETPIYSLRLIDTTFTASGEVTLVRTDRFGAGVAANMGVHVDGIFGDAGIFRQPVSELHVGLSIGSGVFALFRITGATSLGWSIDANVNVLRQQYFVANVLAVDVRPVALDASIWMSVAL